MEKIRNHLAISKLIQFGDHIGVKNQSQHTKQESHTQFSSPNFHSKEFSDHDLDQILKNSHITTTPQHRLLARFLLEHNITLNQKLFEQIDLIFPNSQPKDIEVTALLISLSKIPLHKLSKGYQSILETLNQQQYSVVNEISHLIGSFRDLIALSFDLKNSVIKPQILRDAIEEEILFYSKMTNNHHISLKLLIERTSLIHQLRNYINLSINSKNILSQLSPQINNLFFKTYEQSINTAHKIINLLLLDAILSNDDQQYYIKENGYFFSAGYSLNTKTIPCFLRIHDKENPKSRELDEHNIVLYFKWHCTELDTIDAKMTIENHDVNIQFSSEHPNVLKIIESEKIILEQRLKSLGYEHITIFAQKVQNTQNLPIDIEEPETKIQHFDSQA